MGNVILKGQKGVANQYDSSSVPDSNDQMFRDELANNNTPESMDSDYQALFGTNTPKDPIYQEEVLGKIPKHETFLQRIISNHKNSFADLADVPQVAFQTGQGFLGNAPQNILENPLSFAMGGPGAAQSIGTAKGLNNLASLFGFTKHQDVENPAVTQYLEPQSLVGKVAGIAGNVLAPAGSGAIWGATKIGKAASEVGAAEKGYQAIQDIGNRKDLIQGLMSENYGNVLDKVKTGLDASHQEDILNKTISKIGRGESAETLAGLRTKLVKDYDGTVLTGRDLKNWLEDVSSKLPNGHAQDFGNIAREEIGKISPEFSKMQSTYANTSEGLKDTKRLSNPVLEQIARGKKFAPSRLEELKAVERENLGTSVLPGLIKSGKAHNSAKSFMKLVKGAGRLGTGYEIGRFLLGH